MTGPIALALRRLVVAACALPPLVLAACSVDRGDNRTAVVCDRDEDCESLGRVCRRGYCVSDGSSRPGGHKDGGGPGSPEDAGGSGDGGAGDDAGQDGGPVEDMRCDEPGEQRPCYTGPKNGSQVRGVCRAGLMTCQEDGFFGDCIDEIVPQAEICNGLDDDCNDEIDDASSFGSCTTVMPGVCSEGVLVCSDDGEGICAIITAPMPEQCNGLDDDCDGVVDNGAAAQASCYPGNTGCTDDDGDGVYECLGMCKAGTRVCQEGEEQPCSGFVLPAAQEDCDEDNAEEVADDDDCDGVIDEGCDCNDGATRMCYRGPGGTQRNEPCMAGTQTCTGGSWPNECEGEVLPGVETCANMGADDDCNGQDDDIPLLGTPCTVPDAVGRCAGGTMQCMGNALTCVGPEPREETCDNTDDDCMGGVDEGFNLQEDEQNCGMCGMACTEDAPTCCGGACVDTQTDRRHCGECNNACGSGLTCCGGRCVNLQVDPDNCGRCGMVCGAVQPCCRQGKCAGLLGLLC